MMENFGQFSFNFILNYESDEKILHKLSFEKQKIIGIWLARIESREVALMFPRLFHSFTAFSRPHMHNYLRLQITENIYNGALVTLKGKRNTFIWIFKTVANMQIFRGLFHVKVNLRFSGWSEKKTAVVVELAEREKNELRWDWVLWDI